MQLQPSSTLFELLSNNFFRVPSYQRAYSWETKKDKEEFNFQPVNTFIMDLTDYVDSQANSSFFFGHFLFEFDSDNCFKVIDGQQRLTTIVLFLAALDKKLRNSDNLSEQNKQKLDKILFSSNKPRFSTVDYDQLLFERCLSSEEKIRDKRFGTQSQRRIAAAYNYFVQIAHKLSNEKAIKYLEAVMNAFCSTQVVRNESEAIQMFIFQNNRGKSPTSLELIKAEFLYYVHLKAESERERSELIKQIRIDFKIIYENIVKVDDKINEDEILLCTERIYWKSLHEDRPLLRVQNELKNSKSPLEFITNFLKTLVNCFNQICDFFEEEQKDITYHSFYLSGNSSILLPFIVQAQINNANREDMVRLISHLEELAVRHKLVGTRADLASRLNGTFQGLTSSSVESVFELVEYMRTTEDSWWSHWNNRNVRREAAGYISPNFCKFLLWKYENHLLNSEDYGYHALRYNDIKDPQLEHIAPQRPGNNEKIASGYCDYDEDFIKNYLNTLGNYLLISGRHNRVIGNKPFREKRESYEFLQQQKEIKDNTEEKSIWGKMRIRKREEKILNFIFDYYNC